MCRRNGNIGDNFKEEIYVFKIIDFDCIDLVGFCRLCWDVIYIGDWLEGFV